MNQKDIYNTLLTKGSFGGHCFSPFSKKVCDDDGKIMATIFGRNLKDLNGTVIAKRLKDSSGKGEFEVHGDGEGNTDAKSEKTTIFYSTQNKDIYFVKGEDFLLGSEKIGTVEPFTLTSAHVFYASIVCLVLAIIFCIIALSCGTYSSGPVIELRDINGNFSDQKNLIVFDDRLKPGANGEYNFVIKNPHGTTVEYTIEFLKIELAENGYFPLEFQLKVSNQTVGDGWRKIEDMKFDKIVILPNSDQAFTLCWEWPFEKDNNTHDTMLGIEGRKISIAINVSAVKD